MGVIARAERLALLLHLLGEDASNLTELGLEDPILEDVRSALQDYEHYPPSQEEIEVVLGDFEDYFRLALSSIQVTNPEQQEEEESNESGEDPVILQIAEEQFDVELEPRKRFEAPKLTGNVAQDLNRVHPYQVAQVIGRESSTIAAVVLRALASEHAAKTLEFMPEQDRPRIFLALAQPASIRIPVAERVLERTLELALKIEERLPEQDAADKMANLMRSLPRKIRTPMLQELCEQDVELAEAVKKKLYRFEDLERLDNRDLQKLLGQCRTDVLVLALQKVDESLLNRVLSNMSKRAKEALQEEMEYRNNASEVEIESGRSEVLKVLVQLDESGAVTLS